MNIKEREMDINQGQWVKAQKQKLTVDLHDLMGGTLYQKEIFRMALRTLEIAVNSPQFCQMVSEYRYNFNGANYEGFTHNDIDGEFFSPWDVYTLLKSGVDKFNKEKDLDLDLNTELYLGRFSSAVGFTYPDTYKTWSNTKFWSGDLIEIISTIVGNVLHEYMHNCGFDHPYRWTPLRDHSVNYAIGSIGKALAMDTLSPLYEKAGISCSGWWIFKKCKIGITLEDIDGLVTSYAQ